MVNYNTNKSCIFTFKLILLITMKLNYLKNFSTHIIRLVDFYKMVFEFCFNATLFQCSAVSFLLQLHFFCKLIRFSRVKKKH